jgi:hypothetical protein
VGIWVAVLVGSGVPVGSSLKTDTPDELQEFRRKNNSVIAMALYLTVSRCRQAD